MKKIFGLLAALILLTGCDDGDMSFRTFNFTDAAPTRCDNQSSVFYKINGTEVLIFELSLQTALVNIATETGQPRIVTTDLTYRNYSSTVTNSTLCSNIPPTSPSVLEEWQGEGRMAITTTAVTETTNGVTRITGYSHQITLQTGTFTKDGEEIIITDVNLGTISRDLGFDFDFLTTSNPPAQFTECPTTPNTYYRLDGTEALVLTLGADVLPTEPTSQPVVINLQASTDANTLLLRVFSSSIGATSICGSNPPITPTETQRWDANQGTLEITTTQNGPGLTHTLRLKLARFRDTASTAVYLPVPNADYLIGVINEN
ncbi:hypothetical protein AM493_01885 [Flavobacterium akiainvivens]|uniref:Lipoprotein n=1 Tax=Flavobacterium akiainvivens TaxID=1202724 RepID=A0A0M8M7E1_9FLAO|nr:hypothetical protein [Flavobacterium akiainvivens]KOS04923.1 hypothetical protein AM493_01885 [Flavobacterium akiainvivens]SFQ42080.1 hypothetical protein SAMN05444144_104146 [Flavobacterium akiainvivens]